jgi:glycine cleavage system H protein
VRTAGATGSPVSSSITALSSTIIAAAASVPRMAEASYPSELLYHPEHDWVRMDGDIATFGITWYAQDALGEVVFFDPPEVGTSVTKDEPYAEVESVKAVSDVIAPLSGEIVEVNTALGDGPEAINADPYGDGWLVKVKLSEAGEQAALLEQSVYVASLS